MTSTTWRVRLAFAGIGRGATGATVESASLMFLGLAMGPGVLAMMVITVHVANRYGISRAEHGTISANADRQLQVTRRLARR